MRRLLVALFVLMLPGLVAAQSQFRTVAKIDNAAVTAFELDQRTRLLELLRAPGAGRDLALEQLIEDRLKMAAARRAGLSLNEDALVREMENFAGRANLSLEELTRVLNGNGVEQSALRDFVEVGVTWRELVRSRFSGRVQISDAEIDRALGQSGSAGSLRVLLNEIVLPARPIRGEAQQAQRNAQRITQIRSISAFQTEARRLSVSPSRARSGRLDWINLSDLPAPLRPILLDLSPGEVTQPLRLENAILLFQLRDIEELETSRPAPAAIDYAALYLPGGRSDAALREADRIKARIDTCDDLYGVARKMPREALERGSKSPDEIPQDVAIELAKLDPGEVSTMLTRADGETLVFLMLCSRVPNLDGGGDRDAVRNQLSSARLNGFADSFLAELRAQSVIVIE